MKNHYRQSDMFLQIIKGANNILVTLHKNPDPDSYASALSLSRYIKKLGINAQVISAFPVDPGFNFLSGFETIKIIGFHSFDFSNADLLIIPDTAVYDRVTGDKRVSLPDIKKIVIDHHQNNNLTAELKLVDSTAVSTTEMIYYLFGDWGYRYDRETASLLFSGISGDTVNFKYSGKPIETFSIAAELLKRGADFMLVVDRLYDSFDYDLIRLVGLFLVNMKIEKAKSGVNFIWSAISYKDFVKYKSLIGAKETAANLFFRSIKDTGFGLVILETAPQNLEISFRSKSKIDSSKIAGSFGGGGHKPAAGATVQGEFSQTIKKVIDRIISLC